MAVQVWHKTNYPGVRFRESSTRRVNGRPDRYFVIRYRKVGEAVGWQSDGVTAQYAARIRGEIVQNIREGKHPQSLREKREMEIEQRRNEQERQEIESRERLTFGDLMEDYYLPWAKKNKRSARDDFCRYKNWLAPHLGEKPLKEISTLDLEQLKQVMYSAGKADATVKQVLCLVRQAYNMAKVWGHYEGDNPCKGVKFPSPNNARQKFLTKEEATLLLSELRKRSPQVARIASFALYGGLRLGEILSLKWSHINTTQDIITVFDTKNNEARSVFITDPIKQVLNEMTPGNPDELVFTTKKGNQIRWLSKSFIIAVHKLGFNEGIHDPRQKVTFHTLRHTFASWAVMAGTPLFVVAKALGHKTTVMTQRYAHLAPKSQKKAFEAVALAGKTDD